MQTKTIKLVSRASKIKLKADGDDIVQGSETGVHSGESEIEDPDGEDEEEEEEEETPVDKLDRMIVAASEAIDDVQTRIDNGEDTPSNRQSLRRLRRMKAKAENAKNEIRFGGSPPSDDEMSNMRKTIKENSPNWDSNNDGPDTAGTESKGEAENRQARMGKLTEDEMKDRRDRQADSLETMLEEQYPADPDTSSNPDPSSTGGLGTQDEEEEEAGEKELTDFEKTGIINDRELAVWPAKNFIKTAPDGSGSGFKGQTLADNINFEVQKLISIHKTAGGASLRASGFVNRAVPDYDEKNFLDQVVEMAWETSGLGSSETQLAQVFSRHDRFGRSMVMKNAIFSGYTFFTRPRLCLADWNIIADRKLQHLVTTDIHTIPFAIRCLLDTRFAAMYENAANCPLFDMHNPFLVPFCNAVRSVSGFNDPTLVTETTEGGFFSEDQTYVIGGDRLAKTYDINCQFRDYPGSPILALADAWCQYMAGLTDGSLQQYSDAIDLNRMDYTVSIYRFLMDRTNRYIMRWAKCTGCFPVSPPSGVTFNLNEGEAMVNAAAEINVPFKANRIEYDDPVILREFNMLVRRYAYDAADIGGKPHAFAHFNATNNFAGIPYIRPSQNGYELIWIARNEKGGELFYDQNNGTLASTKYWPKTDGDQTTDYKSTI